MIIHEEGEAGHDMPDLERPVQAVSKAVENLVKVRTWKISNFKRHESKCQQHDISAAMRRRELSNIPQHLIFPSAQCTVFDILHPDHATNDWTG